MVDVCATSTSSDLTVVANGRQYNRQSQEYRVDVSSIIESLKDDNFDFGNSDPLNVSRYDREFQEMGIIGQGAFGSVHKAKHKLDGNLYAIKKVVFDNKGFTNPYIKKVLREVQCLAKCDHPNVNRYYSAWLEPTWLPSTSTNLPLVSTVANSSSNTLNGAATAALPSHFLKSKRHLLQDIHQLIEVDPIENSGEISSSAISHLRQYSSAGASTTSTSVFDVHHTRSSSTNNLPGDLSFSNLHTSEFGNEDNGSIEFENFSLNSSYHTTSVRSETKYESLVEFIYEDDVDEGEFEQAGLPLKPKAKKKKKQQSSKENSCVFKYQITLYIQMYLCENSTLRDWLDDRNSGSFREVDFAMNLKLFKQLVEGLSHVHKQGIIHRDLKPSNVFLGSDGCLKIGDFGLSKLLEHVAPRNSPSSCVSPISELRRNSDSIFESDWEYELPERMRVQCHTSGVGTMTYASPEQSCSQEYDEKADSFSLGIILLEMFVPFGTLMERANAIKNIKSAVPILPDEIEKDYPEIGQLVLNLVAPTACRYSTEQTLDYLNVNFPQVQLKHAKEVIELREKLSEKDQKLQDQDSYIKELEQKIQALSTTSQLRN